MKKEMLINVLQPEECRIAIVEDGILEELYVERTSHESYTGNIYKGKIVNLEPAIQAAFVDFSVGRNGFLHVSDVEPQYYRRHLADDAELGARDQARDPRRERDEPRAAPAPPRTAAPRPHRDRPDRSETRPPRRRRRFGEGLVEDPGTSPRPRPGPPRRPRAPAPPPRPEPAAAAPSAIEPEPRPERARRADIAPRSARSDEPRLDPAAPARADPPRGRVVRGPRERPRTSTCPTCPPSRTRRAIGRAAPAPAPGARTIDPVEPSRPRARPAVRRARARARPPAAEARRGRARPRPRPAVPAREPEARVEPEAEPAGDPRASTPIPDDLPEARPAAAAAVAPPSAPEAASASRARPRELPPRTPRRAPSPTPSPGDPSPCAPGRSSPSAARAAEPERARAPRPAMPSRRARRSPSRRPRPEPPRDRPKRDPRPGRRAGLRPPPRAVRGPRAPPAPRRPPPLDWLDLDDVSTPRTSTPRPSRPATTPRPTPGTTAASCRRRRRGRRRDARREPEAEPGRRRPAPTADELDADDSTTWTTRSRPHDPPRGPSRPRPERRPPAAAPESPRTDDDFDFGDEPDDDDDEDDDDEDAVAGRRPRAARAADPDDEIDPELEEEIRREIEEIAELEREMGLRGTDRGPPPPRRRARPPPAGGRAPRGRGMVKPPLQEIFRRGDEVLVQVIKESIGTKGPTLSTYISIPGRYLVLMPGLNRVGVSRKIADEGQRRKLREIMTELNPPKGLGFIVRTAGLDRTKRELARDLAYLLRLWKVILRRIKKAKAPAPIYQESDMITRTIRDIFTAEIDTIWIDEPAAFERAQEFLRVVMPKFVNRLKLYDEKVPLFHKYGIEEEIAKIQRRQVPLPEGGSIVIDQTEALVAIDVNSGNFRVENDAEQTAYEMNLRAAKEIARQLRLRDLGGVIVNDFIDMRDERNRRGVERALRDAIKRDRARTKVLRMSQFGLIEMTRQRIRPSLKRSVYEDCPHCRGAGVVKTVESMSIDVMRLLALASHREDIRRVNIGVSPDVAAYLNNRKRHEIARLETEANMIDPHPARGRRPRRAPPDRLLRRPEQRGPPPAARRAPRPPRPLIDHQSTPSGAGRAIDARDPFPFEGGGGNISPFRQDRTRRAMVVARGAEEFRPMYAIFEDGSHQFRVSEGDVITVDRRDGEHGAEVTSTRSCSWPAPAASRRSACPSSPARRSSPGSSASSATRRSSSRSSDAAKTCVDVAATASRTRPCRSLSVIGRLNCSSPASRLPNSRPTTRPRQVGTVFVPPLHPAFTD